MSDDGYGVKYSERTKGIRYLFLMTIWITFIYRFLEKNEVDEEDETNYTANNRVNGF
jgi:hypothetical protein